jgi:AraC-like DNA-binding protein
MATISRAPAPALRPFVASVWASDAAGERAPAGAIEHVLPTGRMHLVVRVSAEPITLVERGERRALGCAVIGGARSSYYVKELGAPSAAVGAQLHPGAAALLFGCPAGELGERHTPLADVWGRAAAELAERVAAARSLADRLAILEAALAARLPRARELHPAIAHALAAIEAPADDAPPPIARLVAASGYSHRVFAARFRDAVGLGPKQFARVVRFQRAVRRIAGARDATLADARRRRPRHRPRRPGPPGARVRRAGRRVARPLPRARPRACEPRRGQLCPSHAPSGPGRLTA